ncbi:hypothetical protein [Paenibacillus glycinis]|uniref:DUF4367 domain-containing protein n=1 Tax=Paenibacillus glycinis TaxID=2697035 RepID=A0ABW9XZH7_9BACL|nr:hypothetical protein [Paenibacillus glycinis]NBD28138.1 hypothetical protein [Paenibacillus glycinis]
MSDMDAILRQQLREEADELLFSDMGLSDRVKRNIRQHVGVEKVGRRFVMPRMRVLGTAALAVAVMIVAGFLLLQRPDGPGPANGGLPPANGGVAGSELSQLISTTLSSVEEAKAAFGAGLNVPKVLPEGYALSEIVSAGIKNEPVRDVVFTYVSGERTMTFLVSRAPAAFPKEMFTPTKVGGDEGFVFAQPTLTELYWTAGGVQYGITAPITADEAMKVAESVNP